jgi:hypothetical protein
VMANNVELILDARSVLGSPTSMCVRTSHLPSSSRTMRPTHREWPKYDEPRLAVGDLAGKDYRILSDSQVSDMALIVSALRVVLQVSYKIGRAPWRPCDEVVMFAR